MSQPVTVDALVDQILAGQAPERLRSAAARGALPLPRVTLSRIYVHLLEDPDEGVRSSARLSLDQLEHAAIKELLADRACAPEVLSHYAIPAARDSALAEGIVFHPAAPIEALGVLAATGSGAVVELVLTNEERLHRHPALLEKLMNNPALRANHRGRVLELLERAIKEQDRSRESENRADAANATAEDLEAAQLLEIDVGELLFKSEIIDGDEFAESAEPQIRSTYRRIMTLSTGQKAILALKGGREERTILIRDTNKIVSLGVLKNPRMTDGEVESIAKMRNVSDDVLRQLASKRDWVKNYQVVVALITNPRAPQAVTSNFVSRLTSRDLKAVIASREVPELIRRMARRTFDMRTKKAASNFKKK